MRERKNSSLFLVGLSHTFILIGCFCFRIVLCRGIDENICYHNIFHGITKFRFNVCTTKGTTTTAIIAAAALEYRWVEWRKKTTYHLMWKQTNANLQNKFELSHTHIHEHTSAYMHVCTRTMRASESHRHTLAQLAENLFELGDYLGGKIYILGVDKFHSQILLTLDFLVHKIFYSLFAIFFFFSCSFELLCVSVREGFCPRFRICFFWFSIVYNFFDFNQFFFSLISLLHLLWILWFKILFMSIFFFSFVRSFATDFNSIFFFYQKPKVNFYASAITILSFLF